MVWGARPGLAWGCRAAIGPGLRETWLGGEGAPLAWPHPGEGGPGLGVGEAVLGESGWKGQAGCPGAEQATAGVGSRGPGAPLLVGGTG